MDTTYHTNQPASVRVSLNPITAFIAKFSASLSRLTRPANDPAAQRYSENKYAGDID
jgi:hypothetical protein